MRRGDDPPPGVTTSTRTNGTLNVSTTAPASAGNCSSTRLVDSSRAAKDDTTS